MPKKLKSLASVDDLQGYLERQPYVRRFLEGSSLGSFLVRALELEGLSSELAQQCVVQLFAYSYRMDVRILAPEVPRVLQSSEFRLLIKRAAEYAMRGHEEFIVPSGAEYMLDRPSGSEALEIFSERVAECFPAEFSQEQRRESAADTVAKIFNEIIDSKLDPLFVRLAVHRFFEQLGFDFEPGMGLAGRPKLWAVDVRFYEEV